MKPIIQVTNTTPFQKTTENIALTGNRDKPLQSYTDIWEATLVPSGGLTGALLEGILYTASVAFTVSIGGYLLVASSVVVVTYTIGGMVAVVMDRRLAAPWYLRTAMLALGFIIALL